MSDMMKPFDQAWILLKQMTLRDGKSQFADALEAQKEMERRMLAAEQFQAGQ